MPDFFLTTEVSRFFYKKTTAYHGKYKILAMENLEPFLLYMKVPADAAKLMAADRSSMLDARRVGDTNQVVSSGDYFHYNFIFRFDEEFEVPGKKGFHAIETDCGDGTYINVERGPDFTMKYVTRVTQRHLISEMSFVGTDIVSKAIYQRCI